jgi:hypothetical protein
MQEQGADTEGWITRLGRRGGEDGYWIGYDSPRMGEPTSGTARSRLEDGNRSKWERA